MGAPLVVVPGGAVARAETPGQAQWRAAGATGEAAVLAALMVETAQTNAIPLVVATAAGAIDHVVHLQVAA